MLVTLLLHLAVTTSGSISQVDVVLKEAKPLRIVREGKERAMSGVLSISVANSGSAPAHIETLDVHGLSFRNVKTGDEHVMIHPCDCAFIAWGERAPENRSFTLGPGESRTITLEDWSCGGSVWEPPTRGTWELRYRVLTKKRATGPMVEKNPSAMVKACDATLRSKEFWEHAAVSKPLTVTLKR